MQHPVLCAHKTFIEHRHRLVAQIAQVSRELAWQIFVKF